MNRNNYNSSDNDHSEFNTTYDEDEDDGDDEGGNEDDTSDMAVNLTSNANALRLQYEVSFAVL